jgi:DNA invertase Pin-like site-specific DNA recombinase
MLVGYARTSTIEQAAGLAAQRRDLKAAGCEKIFAEQVSSVAARLLDIVEDLEGRGIALVVLSMGGQRIDTRSPTGKLMLTMLGAIATFERDLMLERQREGIAKAVAEGKYKGRAPTARAKAVDVLRLAEAGETREAIAADLGIGVASVYRILVEARANGALAA